MAAMPAFAASRSMRSRILLSCVTRSIITPRWAGGEDKQQEPAPQTAGQRASQ
jgi:hypothetical protein